MHQLRTILATLCAATALAAVARAAEPQQGLIGLDPRFARGAADGPDTGDDRPSIEIRLTGGGLAFGQSDFGGGMAERLVYFTPSSNGFMFGASPGPAEERSQS